MRILYIINSLDGGGGALPLPDILGVMRDAGHELRVVALMERDGRARGPLSAAGFAHDVIGGARRSYVATSVRLNALIRDWRPELLWTSLTHATIAGELAGLVHKLPVVSWLHNAWLKPANQHAMRSLRALSRHWVADSHTVAAFGRETLGIDPARMSVWPLFLARPGSARRPAPSARFRIGSLGRLHPNKGYAHLIDAVALLAARRPDLTAGLSVHIAGEGAERAALLDRCARLGVGNVVLEGFLPQPAPFLESLDAYVQPSHHEGFCIAAHEAMLAGLPVIASPVGEMACCIRSSGGGLLVPYGDAAGLARAIERLADDRAAAQAMGARGSAWVANAFSAEAFVRSGRSALAAAGIS